MAVPDELDARADEGDSRLERRSTSPLGWIALAGSAIAVVVWTIGSNISTDYANHDCANSADGSNGGLLMGIALLALSPLVVLLGLLGFPRGSTPARVAGAVGMVTVVVLWLVAARNFGDWTYGCSQ